MRKNRRAEKNELKGHTAGTADMAETYFPEDLPNTTRYLVILIVVRGSTRLSHRRFTPGIHLTNVIVKGRHHRIRRRRANESRLPGKAVLAQVDQQKQHKYD